VIRTLAILAVILAAGCASTRQASYVAGGTFGGKPFQVRIEGTEQGSSGVDLAAILAATMDGLRGDLLGALAAMKPQSPSSGPDWLQIAGGVGAGLTAATTGYLAVKKREQVRQTPGGKHS
jgi:hypothetical protein